jgi:hypothetical protein
MELLQRKIVEPYNYDNDDDTDDDDDDDDFDDDEDISKGSIIQNDDYCSIGFDARLFNALQTVGQAAGECYFLGGRWILFSRRVWEREGKPVSMDTQ